MIGCWIYNAHLPAALSWWLVNVACMALMAVIGEYMCMRTELRAIPVNTAPKSNLWGLFRDRCGTAGRRIGRAGVLTNAAAVFQEGEQKGLGFWWCFGHVTVFNPDDTEMWHKWVFKMRRMRMMTSWDFPQHSHNFKGTIVIIFSNYSGLTVFIIHGWLQKIWKRWCALTAQKSIMSYMQVFI